MKLHEYLATGRPVVGSQIRSRLEFSDVIRRAGTPERWSQALTESLATDAIAPAWVGVCIADSLSRELGAGEVVLASSL